MRLLAVRRPKVLNPLADGRTGVSTEESSLVTEAELRAWPSEVVAPREEALSKVATADTGLEEILSCCAETRPYDNKGWSCTGSLEVLRLSLLRSWIFSPSSRAFLMSSSASRDTCGAASAPELIRIEAGESDTSTLVALNMARIEGDEMMGRYSSLSDEEAIDLIDCVSAGGAGSNTGASTAIAPDRDGALMERKNGGP